MGGKERGSGRVGPMNAYLDASSLRKARWPDYSGLLGRISQLARVLGIELMLPEPTRIELEGIWLREIYDAQVAAKDAGAGMVEWTLPDWDQLRVQYRDRAEKLRMRWSLHYVPFTNKSAADVFHTLMRQDPPFQNQRPGFRDAVVFHSIVDHLRSARVTKSLIVANDKGFESLLDASERAKLKAEGFTLRLLTIEAFRDWLESELRDVETDFERSFRQEEEARARAALEASRPQLEAFMRGHLMYHPGAFGYYNPLHFQAMEVGKIGHVSVVAPPETEPGQSKILAQVQVRVTALISPIMMTVPTLSSESAEMATPIGVPFTATASGGSIGHQSFEFTADVEATAEPHNNGYRITGFVSAIVPLQPQS